MIEQYLIGFSKKTLLLFFLVFHSLFAFPQVNGFYSEIKDPTGKTWRVGDVLETDNGFLFSLRDQSSSMMESKVIRMSKEGVLLNEKCLSATDTTINLCSLFSCSDDNACLVGLGVCTLPDDNALLLTLCLDDELNELNRSLAPLPASDSAGYWLDDYRFLQTIDGYFALLCYQGSPTKKEIKLCKISNEGLVTQVERMEDSLVFYVANLFHVHDNPDGFGVFLHKRQIPGTHVNTCTIVYDSNLQLNRICDVSNWYEDDGHGNIYDGHLSLYNSMMLPSPDGGYYISSRLYELALTGTTAVHDQSSVMAKTDADFHTQPQYSIIGHLNDTVEVPSFYKSIDVNDEGVVYQCSMQNIIFGSSWPYGSNGTHLVVTKADKDLNVLWQKCFLKDGNVYSAFQTIATSDGGYLIIGNVYDHNPERSQDVFIMKINADGNVGVGEIQEENMAFVYPNPTKGLLRIGGVEAKETKIYNTLGQCVMSFRGNEASVESLAEGVYLLRIKDGQGRNQILRLVVDK